MIQENRSESESAPLARRSPCSVVDVGFAGSEPDAGLVATAANVGLAVPSASDAMAIPESVRESVFTSALS